MAHRSYYNRHNMCTHLASWKKVPLGISELYFECMLYSTQYLQVVIKCYMKLFRKYEQRQYIKY